MLFNKFTLSSFIKSKEFKLFLTIWFVYIFYTQMFTSSCMANSNSALTASIVNEGRLEIDTYYRASCDISFYDGHYYSGMNPGISFISAPIYAASKPIFYILPEKVVDSLFEKLENYGETLPVDFWGKKKKPSNYFPDLNKRQIIEHLVISGIILPAFTTSLFSALSAILLYSLLKRFTRKEWLRILITLLYAFGTLLFPLATEFFQRPIALAFMLAAFIILFRIKHRELKKSRGTALFASGLLAGLSIWFDYFHLFVIGLLFLYLLSFSRKIRPHRKAHNQKFFGYFNLYNYDLSGLFKFAIGAIIPLLLFLLYHYIVFDDPFSTAYTYRVYADYSLHGLSGIKLLSLSRMMYILDFFLYSPILIFAFYGIYRTILKKDKYFHEAMAVVIYFIMIFAYTFSLTVIYPSIETFSHKRYMLPLIPFAMAFIPYAFNKKRMSKVMMASFFIIGFISIFFNWTAAQYGGHQALRQYDIHENRFTIIPQFLENGPSSPFLTIVSG